MKTTSLFGTVALAAIATVVSTGQADAQLRTSFKAAPEFSDADGDYKFKVRGRWMYDLYSVDADVNANANDESYRRTGLRRARIGVEGNFTKKFKYKAEVTLRNGSTVEWEDAFVEYVGDSASIIIGNNKETAPLEEYTSSRYITFTERASYLSAFGYERLGGIVVRKVGEKSTFTAGIYGDSLNVDDSAQAKRDEQVSVSARLTYAPKIAAGDVLHFGGSVRYRDRADDSNFRYRARPNVGFGTRFVDTGSSVGGVEDTTYGVEAALVKGPLSIQGEYAMLNADMSNGTSPEFVGGYVDASFFLTGESRPYREGAFNRVRPNAPVSEGGRGAFQVGARYDYVDLSDLGNCTATTTPTGAVCGGVQKSYVLGLTWYATQYVQFKASYAFNDIEQRANWVGDANTFVLRTQFDF